jgi:hypothetical protein
MTYVPFATAHEVSDRFLALLHKHGIDPPAGSAMDDELLSLTQLIEVTKDPNLATGPNQVSILRSAAGIHDLAAKVLSVETILEFPRFLEHLRLIAEKKVPAASLGQNASSGPYDHTARKMAELYLGCLAAHAGTDVNLDHPTNATGDNPDVIFTVEEVCIAKEAKRWALAIKTISSRQGQTIFHRIKEGAEQIDSVRCRADVGIVVINAKSALDHEALWNPTIPFPDLPAAINALRAQLEAFEKSAADQRPQSEWDDLFKGKVVRPIIFMGQSLVKLPTAAHAQTPTPLKMLKLYDAQGAGDPVAVGIAGSMNHFMQTVLQGIPGSAGQMPR